MMLERREVLTGGLLAIAAAAIGGMAARPGPKTVAEVLPAGLIPADRAALILHHGDAAAIDFLRAVRADAGAARISDRAVAVLAPQGFARTGALLDGARGTAVIALLDEGDALAVEAMLRARGSTGLTRRRYRARTLLTARI